MKIVLTGSLGHIGKPLAENLIHQGNEVTVISHTAARQKDIENSGAKAAIGDIQDADFLAAAFTGADVAYCMVPPVSFRDSSHDPKEYCRLLGENFAHAVRRAGVGKVVHLSSIGAHLTRGSGLILMHRQVEDALAQLPAEVAVTTLRPVGFYYNMLSFIPLIKSQGYIASNYGGDDLIAWVSPLDIADVAAEEITRPMQGRRMLYVASDEVRCSDAAVILGRAIGMPALQWKLITSEMLLHSLTAAGMPQTIAAPYVEMNAAMHTGLLSEDYLAHRPVLGKIKMKDFAEDFATVFQQN